jgi:hypothetical protein
MELPPTGTSYRAPGYRLQPSKDRTWFTAHVMSDHTRRPRPVTGSTRRLRRTAVVLEALMVLGTLAGIQGFLSGAFTPLVEDLETSLPIDGPVVPAVALGLVVGGTQALALILGVANRDRAPQASLVAGSVLVAWVLVQLPLIGWTAPVQWAVFAVGVVEVAVATTWLRRLD